MPVARVIRVPCAGEENIMAKQKTDSGNKQEAGAGRASQSAQPAQTKSGQEAASQDKRGGKRGGGARQKRKH